MKVVTVVGARPQFIKAAAVSRAIGRWNAEGRGTPIAEAIVHTGQHFDHGMSQTFFDELGIPEPAYNLDIHGGGHGRMTGRMLEAIEEVLMRERPEWVLVYGDTNSTLAGALAAVKMHIPVAHVEAGLRSYNLRMPEEVNRILTDRVSRLLFCPTARAAQNLHAEGVSDGIHHVGDVMFDVALHYRDEAARRSTALRRLELEPGRFVLVTCHRAENTDEPARLAGIVTAVNRLAERMPVVLPLHPRTANVLRSSDLALGPKVRCVEPLPFLDMVQLEQACALVLTDSGGVQKEAFFYGRPCVTMRDETEWVETVETGWNVLAGADPDAIESAALAFLARDLPSGGPDYGDGTAAERIVRQLGSPTTE